MNRRGLTLIEVTFAAATAIAVLSIGFRYYVTLTRIDDVEARRETATMRVQDAISRIKIDVRAGASVSGSGESLLVNGPRGRVLYRTVNTGLRRETDRGRRVFTKTTAEYAFTNGGVNVTVRAKDAVHRRPIRIEISSFVRPRN